MPGSNMSILPLPSGRAPWIERRCGFGSGVARRTGMHRDGLGPAYERWAGCQSRGMDSPGWRRRPPAWFSVRRSDRRADFSGQTNIPVAVAVFAMVLWLHLSLPLTMLIMLPVSLFFAWRSA